MEYYNAETKLYTCPCEGCSCTYKSLKTLNNHFNRKHPSADKPVSIVDTMHRQADAKVQAKIDAKTIIVNGMNFQEFKKAKFAELPATMSFGDKNKAVCAMWKDAKEGKPVEILSITKTVNVPIIKPDTKPVPLTNWVITAIRRIAEEMDVDSIEDLLINPDQAEMAVDIIKCMIQTPKPKPEPEPEPEPEEVVEWIDNPVSEPETIETVTEEPTEETSTVDDDDETADVPYDAKLVDCCKTWRTGGMAKAYKLINAFFTIKPNKKDKKLTEDDAGTGRVAKPYIVQPTDRKARPASLSEVKELMENIFDILCDEWFDYTRSDDYNEETDAELFDDQVEWMDFCHEAITEETVKLMMA